MVSQFNFNCGFIGNSPPWKADHAESQTPVHIVVIVSSGRFTLGERSRHLPLVAHPGDRAMIPGSKRPSVDGLDAEKKARSGETVEEVLTANRTDLASTEHSGYGRGAQAV